MLEGNPFTFPEVKTLLDGVTIGGRKIADQEQVLNLAESSRRLLAMVKSGQFALSKTVVTEENVRKRSTHQMLVLVSMGAIPRCRRCPAHRN